MQAQCSRRLQSQNMISETLLSGDATGDDDDESIALRSSEDSSAAEVDVSLVKDDILNNFMSSSVCSDHICCPSQSADDKPKHDSKLSFDKPALIYRSFKKLLDNLKSLEWTFWPYTPDFFY